ncbi:FK506-binding protein 2-like isoform X2 [Cucurbita pepo subsp. pepo]|uniref:FK506-binding protein 2-like isoform X2 n=1 Tax=Cucurbita pepo subsp. pepo TaxID=3664 RepID=UPI000C9D38D1|nr:FK506-binding protein 2-like isoform X2 [Cucurbita pepo subsp. pepo]
MKASLIFFLLACTSVYAMSAEDVTKLQIDVTSRPSSCDIKTHKGDKIKVHYRGMFADGTVFDSSFERGVPFEFELGAGKVIKGWDQGLLGMCVGEKRKLTIPSKLGYGPKGVPPTIPGNPNITLKLIYLHQFFTVLVRRCSQKRTNKD